MTSSREKEIQEKTLKSDTIYEGRIITVRVETVELPDMKYAKREIVEHARRQAHEITEGAFNYAHDIMSKLENQLTVYYEVIQEGRSDIQKSLDAMKEQSYEIEYRADDVKA